MNYLDIVTLDFFPQYIDYLIVIYNIQRFPPAFSTHFLTGNSQSRVGARDKPRSGLFPNKADGGDVPKEATEIFLFRPKRT